MHQTTRFLNCRNQCAKALTCLRIWMERHQDPCGGKCSPLPQDRYPSSCRAVHCAQTWQDGKAGPSRAGSSGGCCRTRCEVVNKHLLWVQPCQWRRQSPLHHIPPFVIAPPPVSTSQLTFTEQGAGCCYLGARAVRGQGGHLCCSQSTHMALPSGKPHR